uniref:Uncharacterized protein n=1 Tax=Tanacetum cinerariifolium TaxID=118510 RepID=A0A6L2JFM8_TANCI|nr:hypothetical protein [Tanacetum cinerariifolium]
MIANKAIEYAHQCDDLTVEEFWCIDIAYDPNPPANEFKEHPLKDSEDPIHLCDSSTRRELPSTEQVNSIQQLIAYCLITRTKVDTREIIYSDLVTRLMNKSRQKYISYPRFVSCALEVLLGTEYTQDQEFGSLPNIMSNSNFTKDPSKVIDIELTALVIVVKNFETSAYTLLFSGKKKARKSQIVSQLKPKKQGPEDSVELDFEPLKFTTIADIQALLGTSDDKLKEDSDDDVFEVREEMDEDIEEPNTKENTPPKKNIIKEDTALNNKVLEATEAYTKNSTNLTEFLSMKLVKPSNVVHPDLDEPVRVPYMIYGKMYRLTNDEIQEHLDKEEKIKKAAEEAKLLAIRKSELIMVVHEEASKAGIDPKILKSAKGVLRGTDKRNFDVDNPFNFGDFGVTEWGEMMKIITKKKNQVVKDLMNSLSKRYKRLRTIPEELRIRSILLTLGQVISITLGRKRKHMELEPEIKTLD